MSAEPVCATCGKSSDVVRLYRDYSPSGVFPLHLIRCNNHVPMNRSWWVPCVVHDDGAILPTFPSSGPGTQHCFDRWLALPEADPGGWSRPMRGEDA